MANYEAKFRTNKFRVKDNFAFEKFVDELIRTDADIELDREGDQYTLYGYTSIPSELYNDEKETYESIDFYGRMRKYLADGEILIVQEVGSEKYCYFTGLAVAMDNTGKEVIINIEDIYTKAMQRWNKVDIPKC